jgi:hypothetical protein
MDPEDDPAWQRLYSLGYQLGSNEAAVSTGRVRAAISPRVQLRNYRIQIYRALGLTDAAHEAARVLNEGFADGLADRLAEFEGGQ